MSSTVPKFYSNTKIENEEQKMSRMKVKELISSILEIPNTESWDIFDSIPDKDLYLVHYTDKADTNIYGHIRGTVVDIENKYIVCKSYAYAPIAVADELKIVNKVLTLQDQSGLVHQFPKDTLQIKRGYEGTLVRVFKHRNIIYFSTHKKINCSKSKWGNSITFFDMYKQLVNADPNDFFDKEERDSPVVQLFILVHPDVQHVSKYNFEEGGFSMYIGGRLVRDFNMKSKYEKYLNIEIFATNSEEIIDIADANDFLSYGFCQDCDLTLNEDKRLNPGEFVMIYNMGENGEPIDVLKVQSTGYNWRSFVRNNNSNICHQFYMLFNFLPRNLLNDKFPKIPYVPENYIRKLVDKKPLLMWPTTGKHEESLGVYRIWASVILSVPLSKQKLALELMKNYQEDKKKLKEYLQKLIYYEDLETKDISEDIKNLIFEAKNVKYFVDRPLEDQIIKYLSDKVDRVKGYILYKLIREMNCSIKRGKEVCE